MAFCKWLTIKSARKSPGKIDNPIGCRLIGNEALAVGLANESARRHKRVMAKSKTISVGQTMAAAHRRGKLFGWRGATSRHDML